MSKFNANLLILTVGVNSIALFLLAKKVVDFQSPFK